MICYSTHWCVQCVSIALLKPVFNVPDPDGGNSELGCEPIVRSCPLTKLRINDKAGY